MKDTIIGVDLAKNVFQLHGASMATHKVTFRKKLTRVQFRKFMAAEPPAVVVIEACGSASYWAREMARLGHEVKLIAPQYVRPFVKRQKNDAADAEALAVAAQRPEMRFVEPKSADQQARAVLFRSRERLVHQRTELVNALRSVLYEFGLTVPQGIGSLKRVATILDAPESELPALVREECQDLLTQISEKTARIEARSKMVKRLTEATERSRLLQTMPGIGPLTALAAWPRFCRLARSCPAPELIGRQSPAWAGLKSGSDRHPPSSDPRSDVASELAWPEIDPRRELAGAHAVAQAANAGRDRAGQQDGKTGLGNAHKGRGLSGSGVVGCRLVRSRRAAASRRRRGCETSMT